MSIKQKILENSFDVFYQHGFHDSGVELLAKQAGTTKRTLYAHFGNKDGLIEAVLNYRHTIFMNQLKTWFDKCEDLDSESITSCYLSFLNDWISSDSFYGCMFINACAEFSSHDSIPHTIARQHKVEVREFLLAQFTQAEVNQARLMADTLFIFGEGLIVSGQTGQEDLEWDVNLLNMNAKNNPELTYGYSSSV